LRTARARFIGGNCGWGGWNVPHDQAEKIADYLARNGLNLVRFYLPEFKFTDEHWDRFDYLLHCFKQKGIYIYFYTPDGYDNVGGGFMPGLIEKQKDWWKKLLTHPNPYTKSQLAEDPMLAFVFLCNETGIFSYVRRPEEMQKNPEASKVLTQLWNEWLLRTYKSREGLIKAWAEMGGTLRPDEDPAQATVPIEVSPSRKGRAYDYMLCIDELQRKFYTDMIAHLRALGVKVPISGMNRPNNYHDFRAGAETGQLLGDHYYWSHMTGDGVNVSDNVTMVRDVGPFAGLYAERGNRQFVGAACRGKVKGLPFGIGEWSTLSSANDFRAETQIIMACYAALHDWDFLCHFALLHEHQNWDDVAKARTTWFSTFDPARGGLFPAMSLIFLRHDVETARKVIECVQLEEPYVKALKTPDAERNNNIWEYLKVVAGLPPYQRLAPYYSYFCRVENVFTENPASRAEVVLTNKMTPDEVFRTLVDKGVHGPDLREKLRFASDTGQLVSDVKRGLFTVDAPRVQGAVGFLDEVGRVELKDVVIDKGNTFAVVILSALDDQPISAARRMLLTVVGDADNSDEKRRISGTRTDASAGGSADMGVGKRFRPAVYHDRLKWGRISGHGPTLVEPVELQVTIKGRTGAGLKVYALSAEGERKNELALSPGNGGVVFSPSGRNYKTIYYEIVFGAGEGAGAADK
jgi:hypothetical protein